MTVQQRKTTPWGPVVPASIKGASHEASGACCQDAVSVKEGTFRGEPYMVCCVADGHGSATHVHSDRGAALAALAAEQTAIQFLLCAVDTHKIRPKDFERCVKLQLKEMWIDNIRQAWRSYRLPPDMLHKHGTTLLMALFFRKHVYFAQLGDGVICIGHSEGRASFVKETEPGPIDNVTDSLCGTNLKNKWVFDCIGAHEIETIMMATDGLADSLVSNEAIAELARTLDKRLRYVPACQIRDALPVWLDSYSRQGSQDDISVVTISMNKTLQTKNGEEK